MASTLLSHGTIVMLSKSNATSKTTMGQWAVCILDVLNVFVGRDSGLEGTFNVFVGKEEAEAYLAAHDEWIAQVDVETAAPALGPAPEFRMRELAPDAEGSEQNHPSNLVRNNAELARTMGVTPEESAALTSANFARLFGA